MLASWFVFPLAAALLCLGIGLLIERAAGRRLPGPLLLPTGMATTMALVGPLLSWPTGAGLAFPVLVVLAAAGFLLGFERLRRARPDWCAVGAALAVFALCAAPAAFTGHQTFSGSLVLPDTSNQLQLAQRLSDSGREYDSLPQSSYRVSLNKYLNSQYPVAAQGTLGVLRPLGFSELIWLYQPFLAFLLALAALSLYRLLASWSKRPGLSAAGAFLAAQPALTYAYALQGSIKEIAALSMICAVTALVADAVQARAGARAFLPVAAAATATLGALGPAGAAYLSVPVAFLGVTWAVRVVRDRSWRELAWALGVLGLAVVALLPFLSGASTAYDVGTAVLSMTEDLGNLARPLALEQVTGVWLAGDFRYAADYPVATGLLAVITLVAAAGGVVACVRQRACGPVLFFASLVPVSLYLLHRGSPYADGKVLAIASPAIVLAAVSAVIALSSHRRLRVPAGALALALGLGVLGSNALAYRDVQNAPGERYAELLRIDDRFAGQGPTLLTEYDEYSGYLLRRTQVQSEPESRLGYQAPPFRRPSGVNDPRHRPGVKSSLDIDDLDPAYVQRQRLLLIRHSPATSRPPANYTRRFRGRYYDVWQKDAGKPPVRGHLPLGRNAFSPSATPACGRVLALASRAQRRGGDLAYVARPGLVSAGFVTNPKANAWFQYGAYPRSLVVSGEGQAVSRVSLPAGGVYRIWIGGSFARAVRVAVDGRVVGSVSYEPGNPGQYFALGRVRLDRGPHRVTIARDGGDLRPGDAGGGRGSLAFVTPAVFSPEPNESLEVRTIPPSRATELCGRRLDWIEIVGR